MEGMQIDEAGLSKLHINIAMFKSEILKAGHDGLVSFGLKIVAEAKKTLKENGNVVTGFLRGSGRTVENKDGTVDAGFEADYAGDIEYGRKSGTRPPTENIYQWLVKKRIVPKRSGEGKDAVSKRYALANAIANNIEKNGTKAHPFLSPAYMKYKEDIDEYMQGIITEKSQQFNKG